MSIWRSRLFSLAREQRGVALIEFALIVPFLVLLFIGGFQLMDAISAYRKVAKTVRALADLTTQNTTITTAGADEILNASRQVMAPYSTTNAVLRITEIQVQSSGVGVVKWSRALNGTQYAIGATLAMPGSISDSTNTGSYFVFSEINYSYQPTVGSILIGTIPLKQTIYMSPRNSSLIACSNCT